MKKIFILFLSLVAVSQTWAFEQDKYYTINRNGESGSYIYAADGVMQTGTLNADNGVYVWQFIPTGNPDCYYIKNVATETYIQSSNIELSTNVALGSDPVEYYVSTGAGTTTYFLASNDQGTINYTEDATLGLNKGVTGVVAYYVKTGRGNSYWEINEISYNTTAPEPPADEDPDVCSSIAAYRLPCGTYSAKTRLIQVDITGDGVLTELHYKPATTGRYTLYTQERAELMHEGNVKLTAKLVGASEIGLVVTVWADFDGDGAFEQNVKPSLGELIEAEFTVPAGNAANGRFRIRVDQSGGETANADFYGTMYDLPFDFGAVQTQRTLKVSANAADRGTVSIKDTDEKMLTVDPGTELTVVAEVKEGYFFHGWRKGRTIVSYKPEYTVVMTENKDLVAVFATVEGEVEVEDDGTYPVNFPKNTTATRTDRKLTAVSLTAAGGEKQTLEVTGSKVYNDLTTKESNYLKCMPGDALTVEFTYTGVWMHGYAFVDENADKQFSFTEGSTDQSETEVKSFSFYSGNFNNDASGYNSAGSYLTGDSRNTLSCPLFQAPAEAGNYRIRFKVDWNSIDPGGQLAADGTATGTNGIIANGGFIVDAVLSVGDTTGIEIVETATDVVIYTIDGRRVNNLQGLPKGIYIIGNKKVYVK